MWTQDTECIVQVLCSSGAGEVGSNLLEEGKVCDRGDIEVRSGDICRV